MIWLRNHAVFVLIVATTCFAVIFLIRHFIWNGHHEATQLSSEKDVAKLVAALRTKFPHPRPADLTPNSLTAAGLVSSTLKKGSDLNDPWGGSFRVDPAEINGVPNSGFTLTYTRVPRDDCATLVSSLSPTFQVIRVGLTRVKDIGRGLTLNPSSIFVACNNESNTIAFSTGRSDAG